MSSATATATGPLGSQARVWRAKRCRFEWENSVSIATVLSYSASKQKQRRRAEVTLAVKECVCVSFCRVRPRDQCLAAPVPAPAAAGGRDGRQRAAARRNGPLRVRLSHIASRSDRTHAFLARVHKDNVSEGSKDVQVAQESPAH